MDNTLASANTLIEAGFTNQQSQAMVTVMSDNLATRKDIEALRREMKEGNDKLETALRRDMKEGNDKLETALRRDMKEGNDKLETALRRDMKEGNDKLETALRRDMKEGNDKLEASIHSGLKETNDKLQETTVKMEGMSVKIDAQAFLLKWILAVGGGGVVTIMAAVVTFMLQTFITP